VRIARNAYKILVKNVEGWNHLGDIDICRWVIPK
jgi:hypothetical protein